MKIFDELQIYGQTAFEKVIRTKKIRDTDYTNLGKMHTIVLMLWFIEGAFQEGLYTPCEFRNAKQHAFTVLLILLTRTDNYCCLVIIDGKKKYYKLLDLTWDVPHVGLTGFRLKACLGTLTITLETIPNFPWL